MAKRVGVYIFNGAEIVDWAGPMGVFAVARRMDPELDAFLVADSLAPVMATANLSVNPRYGLDQAPDMDAFLIPGGIGTRAEMAIAEHAALETLATNADHCDAAIIGNGASPVRCISPK